MIKVLKNNTLSEINIKDTGISIPASSQYEIPQQDYLIWSASLEITSLVTNEDIIINNGVRDLPIKHGLALLLDLDIRPKNVYRVSKDFAANGDFETIADALAAITDATANNLYQIEVAPGIYTEPLLVVPPYVSIIGSSIGVVIIEPDSANHDVIQLNNMTEISFFTIRNAGTGYAAVSVSNCGDFSQLHKIAIYDSDIGINFTATSIDSSLYLEYVDFNGDFTNAIKVTSTNGYLAYCNAENTYSFYTGTGAINQYIVDGSLAEFNFLSGQINGGGSDIGVLITNGGGTSTSSTSFRNCDTAIYADTNGTGPRIYCTSVIFDICNTNFNIANTTAVGYFTGYTEYLKQSINKSNDFFITNKDANIITVAKKGGDFTRIYDALVAIQTIQGTGEKFVISIGPGVFSEPLLEVSSDITLIGQTDEITIIVPDGDHDIIHIVGQDVCVYDVELEDAPTGRWALKCYSIAFDVETEFINVNITNCDNGVYVKCTTNSAYVKHNDVHITGPYSKGIEVIATNGQALFASFNGCVLNGTKSGMSSPHISVTGVGARIELPQVRITGPYGTGGATDVGVQVSDGAEYRTNGTYIRHCHTGVSATSGGTAPDIKAQSLRLDNEVYDLLISHSDTKGVFSGIAEFSKISNASIANFAIIYADPITGDYNVSRTSHMRGIATDITAIVASNTTTTLLNTDAHATTITGSTLGQIVRLPDATTLRNGHQIWIINAATVTATTQQYDGSGSLILYPSGSVKYILRDNSTLAGIWNRSVTSSAAFQGTAPVICGYGGNAGSGRYLEYVSGNSSDGSPFTIIAPSTLVGLSMANNSANTTATIGIYKVTNLTTPIATLSLTNQQSTYTADLAVNLAEADRLAVKVISGSMNKPFVCFYISGQ